MSKYKEHLNKRQKEKENSEYGCFEFMCIECDVDVFKGKSHIRNAIDTAFYCGNCKHLAAKETPREYETCVILEDDGNNVKARYQYGRTDSKIENWLRCHWSSKGRFITIKGKRVYL